MDHKTPEQIPVELVGAFGKHQAAFGPTLAEIAELQPVVWAEGMEPRKERPRGYVYVAREANNGPDGSELGPSGIVYIGWGSSTRLREAVGRLQFGNPRALVILGVSQRDTLSGAREICETLHLGLSLYKLRGGWFNVPDRARVAAALAHIDDEPEPPK